MTRDELMKIARTAQGTTRGALVERAKVIDHLRALASGWERDGSNDGADALLGAARVILAGEHVREDGSEGKS